MTAASPFEDWRAQALQRLRCPWCRAAIATNTRGVFCARGHETPVERGVVRLLGERRDEVQRFFDGVARRRALEGQMIESDAILEGLPHSLAREDPGWALRAGELDWLRELLNRVFPDKRTSLSILELGAWNGWLSHNLAELGHQVTAFDESTHPLGGLEAESRYAASWLPVQALTTELDLVEGPYDVVIMNHGVPFAEDPVDYVMRAREKVARGGLLVLLGLSFYPRPRSKAAQVERDRKSRQAEGLVEVRQFKGFLDLEDRRQLARLGIRFKRIRSLRRLLGNAVTYLLPWRPRIVNGWQQIP